jgi:hypothetical protein
MDTWRLKLYGKWTRNGITRFINLIMFINKLGKKLKNENRKIYGHTLVVYNQKIYLFGGINLIFG